MQYTGPRLDADAANGEGRPGLHERIVIADARQDGPAALDRLEALGRAAGWPGPTVLELRLVAEEVVTNVAKYGYEPGATPGVELHVSITGEAAVLEFRDQGRPFDPLQQPPPNLDTPLLERPVGGLRRPPR